MTRILIVDDEPTMRLSLQKLMPFLGYEVAGIAATGDEAVACAKVLQPDVVLMDIVMPGNLDGIDAAKKIRTELDIPVIFLTGYADDAFISRARCAEPYGYLVKPASEETLKAAIELALYKKSQERKRQDAVSHYRDMTQLASHFFWVTAGDFSRIDYAGPTYEQIFGRSRTDLYQNPANVLEAVYPDDLPCVLEGMEKLKAGVMSEIHLRIMLPDGSFKWIRNCAFPVKNNGTVSRIVGISEDFTAHKLMEEALQHSENRFRLLAEESPLGLYETDADGNCLYVNRKWSEIAGLSMEEARGKGWQNGLYIKDRDRIAALWHEYARERKPWHCEYRFCTPEGKITWVLGSAVAIKNNREEITGYLGANLDITDHKRMEEQRIVMEKLESTGILAGGIAHDFNNLLAVIVGNIEMAKTFLPPGEEAFKHLEIAEQSSWKAQTLTQQILTFAKGRLPVAKLIPLPRLIEEQTILTLQGSSLEPVFSFPPGLWAVTADENQIKQVIQHIVRNACEAMEEAGPLAIGADNVVLPSLAGPALSAGSYVKVSIADQGTGIREDLLAKIFDPYFSTKQRGEQKGMGLGLTICRSIVEQHGGAITVTTEINRGTTFYIYLPASGKTFTEIPSPAQSVPSRAGRKILVMDDEDAMRDLFDKSLRKTGYEVTTVEKGEDAVERYLQAKSLGRPFDLVILDLTIRTGKGGLETLKLLKDIDPEVRAVVTSGYSEDPIITGFEQYGFQGALIKPFRLSELRDMIAGILKT